MVFQFIYGFLLAVCIGLIAYKAHSLNKSGVLSATLIGTLIFGIGGWQWAVLLLTFFITSSALSRAFKKRKQNLEEKYSKGNQRDAGQVFGNGILAAFFAVLNFFYPNSQIIWLCFAASLAAVNADTWATELGVLNPTPPRMITNLKIVVEKGTSGGISLIGSLASVGGSALIGILASLLAPEPAAVSTAFIITLAGFCGALFDSLIGGTVQATYYCPADKKETEKYPMHTCGTQTIHIRGWKWLHNDLVNFACAAFGVLTYLILQGII